jgi:Short C-terminal domain
MPPFGFGRKNQPQSFTIDITDKEDLEQIREIAEMLNPNEVRNGMDKSREVYHHPQAEQSQQQQSSISIADELMKLANLKQQGIISEDEFQQMKQDLIRKKT